MPKIGITEAGDASIDLSWTKKAWKMDLMILITKNVTDEFIRTVIPFRDKTIVHATCTGWGGTILEPGVPDWRHQLEQVKKLIYEGFPGEQVVLRIDPIIPTKKGLAKFEEIVSAAYPTVDRFRISVLDNYGHVQRRFADSGLPVLYNGLFNPPEETFAEVDAVIAKLVKRYPESCFEACAEMKLKWPLQIGCVSWKDMRMFGLVPERVKRQPSRTGCRCEEKTEMLSYAHFHYCSMKNKEISPKDSCEAGSCATCRSHQVYGCANRCLYCYWRT